MWQGGGFRDRLWRAVATAALGAALGAACAWRVPPFETRTVLPSGSSEPAGRSIGVLPDPVPPGDFFAIRRWGDRPLRAVREAVAVGAPSGPAQPVFGPVVLVGTIEAGGVPAALVRLSDGRVVRVAPGRALPDGRVVAFVSGDRVVLRAPDGAREALAVFPVLPGGPGVPVPAEVAALGVAPGR